MTSHQLRISAALLGVFYLFLATPRESHAIFHWLRNWCCGETSAAPTYAAAAYSATNPCNQAPVVANYVPQTCCRTQYVTMPVSTYQPVTVCNPCTGLPVTTMRPAISYVRRPQLMPYTTYRVVYSAPLAIGRVQVANYAPVSGCSGCGAAPAATTTPYYAPPAATAPASETAAPTLDGSSAGPTFRNSQNAGAGQQQTARQPLTPIPNPEAEGTSNVEPTAPRLISPDDRTTVVPSRRTTPARTASRIARPGPPARSADRAAQPSAPSRQGGTDWRPSNR